MRVSCGVPTRGAVTATHVAACETQTQVNPRRPRRQALLAARGRTRRNRVDPRGMFAGHVSAGSPGTVGGGGETNRADERLRRGNQARCDAQRPEAHFQQSRHHRIPARQFPAQADRPPSARISQRSKDSSHSRECKTNDCGGGE
jgi:hypothetical protein